MIVNVNLKFTKGYIAHPYWPEMERLINIQKESGVNRMRNAEKRDQSLRSYLDVHNMTMDDYHALEEKSRRPFYTAGDVMHQSDLNGTDPDVIVISAHQMYGCLAEAASWVSASMRVAKVDQLRTVLKVTDFFTPKKEPDGVWDRFVVVKSGTGGTLSNQRSLRSNSYIEDFTARGQLRFVEEAVEEVKVRQFVEFAGREIGVGASRKMGWGRFEVVQWEPAG